MSRPSVFINARGETVMDYETFKELPIGNVIGALEKKSAENKKRKKNK